MMRTNDPYDPFDADTQPPAPGSLCRVISAFEDNYDDDPTIRPTPKTSSCEVLIDIDDPRRCSHYLPWGTLCIVIGTPTVPRYRNEPFVPVLTAGGHYAWIVPGRIRELD